MTMEISSFEGSYAYTDSAIIEPEDTIQKLYQSSEYPNQFITKSDCPIRKLKEFKFLSSSAANSNKSLKKHRKKLIPGTPNFNGFAVQQVEALAETSLLQNDEIIISTSSISKNCSSEICPTDAGGAIISPASPSSLNESSLPRNSIDERNGSRNDTVDEEGAPCINDNDISEPNNNGLKESESSTASTACSLNLVEITRSDIILSEGNNAMPVSSDLKSVRTLATTATTVITDEPFCPKLELVNLLEEILPKVEYQKDAESINFEELIFVGRFDGYWPSQRLNIVNNFQAENFPTSAPKSPTYKCMLYLDPHPTNQAYLAKWENDGTKEIFLEVFPEKKAWDCIQRYKWYT